MAGNDRRRKARGTSMALDTMHIVIGILVVIMAAVSFINPEEYMILFPVIFLLASILNLATGRYKFKRAKRDQRKKAAAVFQMAFGGILVALAVISAISIWWR